MTRVIRYAVTVLYAVLELFIDDGLYTAIAITWITAIVMFGPRHGLTNQTILVVTAGSRQTDRFVLGGFFLAFGLDLIFAVSVILRVRSTVRRRRQTIE
jgi:hypothetical protein